MSIVKYGEWEIDIETEKTKQYYNSLTITDDRQVYRNFAKYCESLTKEEQDFFDSFAINPLICKIVTVGKSKKKLPCGGHYYVYGKYINTPKEIVWTVEQFSGRNRIDDYPDPKVTVGVFQFDFQNPENQFCNIPEDIPEGCICIHFWCEKMPWLLEENCELESIYPPKFWEIGRIIKKWKAHRQSKKDYKKDIEQGIVRSFSEADIDFEIMTEKEVLEYKKQWLSVFAPKDADIRKLNKLCLSSRKIYGFLWHLFSYEYIKTPYSEQATVLFDKKVKDTAVFIENTENLGYRIHNLSKLNSDYLNEWIDVTVTASDFSWTYSKTHESELGPYYYEPTID